MAFYEDFAKVYDQVMDQELYDQCHATCCFSSLARVDSEVSAANVDPQGWS